MSNWWRKHTELDEDQKDVLSLPENEDHLIKGPPGSGKTNLLLLRAMQLISAGVPNITVIVHTRVLKEFVAAGAKAYGVPAAKITTFRKAAIDLLGKVGVKLTLPKGFEQSRALLVDALSTQLKKGNIEQEFDYVLCDEAQDFVPLEQEVLHAVGERYFGVADARQKIYAGPDSLQELEKRVKTTTLRFHYRNGKSICRVADRIARGKSGMESSSKYDEAKMQSTVDVVRDVDVASQVVQLIPKLAAQLKVYPHDTMGVVCPQNDDTDIVAEALSRSSISMHVLHQKRGHYKPFDGSRRVAVTSLHSAKGLEFRAFHILAADGLSAMSMQAQLSYMGVTRAKTSLTVYHSGSMPGFLEAALTEKRALPGVESLLPDDDK